MEQPNLDTESPEVGGSEGEQGDDDSSGDNTGGADSQWE